MFNILHIWYSLLRSSQATTAVSHRAFPCVAVKDGAYACARVCPSFLSIYSTKHTQIHYSYYNTRILAAGNTTMIRSRVCSGSQKSNRPATVRTTAAPAAQQQHNKTAAPALHTFAFVTATVVLFCVRLCVLYSPGDAFNYAIVYACNLQTSHTSSKRTVLPAVHAVGTPGAAHALPPFSFCDTPMISSHPHPGVEPYI